MNSRYFFTCCFLVILTVRPTFAQQTGMPPDSVSLADAIREAMTANPSLKASDARREAAQSRTTEARSMLLPQLKFSGRAAYLSEVPEFSISLPVIGKQTLFPSLVRNYGARVTLQQTLFSGFRTWKQLEMAEHNAVAADMEYGRDRSDLILAVTTAYWNLYRASKLENVLAQSVDQISAHLADVQNFKGQGMATDLDVLRVQTQLSEIRVKHIEAQGNVRLAQMSLNSLIGRPLERLVAPSDAPTMSGESAGAGEDLARVMGQAKERRTEVSAANERRAMQEAAVIAARGGWYPQILLLANYDYARPNSRIIPPKDAWEKTWDIGISVQWNIWDWFATASQSAQAEAGLSQSDAVVVQVKDAVALDAAQSYYSVREARERLAVAALGTEQATETHRITREKFREGVASNSDLLDAETALLQARMTETQASVDYVIRMQKLKRATGELQ